MRSDTKRCNRMIPIYIMGRKYEVPKGLTIQKALEFAGYRLTRGCGCRGGACGACVTLYRKKGSYKLNVGLACQTEVESNMDLMQLAYTPANKVLYSIENVHPNNSAIIKLYPELMSCLGCNACTKSCPIGLEVMNYVAAAIRGDLKTVLELSIECVMCGMCAARCPAELSPFNIALLIRRLYGRYVISSSPQLKHRLKEIKEGKFEDELKRLKTADRSELEKKFKELQATKGAAV
ncbi:Ion-translocating oxidoreductase complex subunit C [subsurface metagenome]